MSLGDLSMKQSVTANELASTLLAYAERGVDINSETVFQIFDHVQDLDAHASALIVRAMGIGIVKANKPAAATEYWKVLHKMKGIHGPDLVVRWLTRP